MSAAHKLVVTPKGGLLLGGTTRPGVNDATARDADGVPFLPATALKGALREQLVRILTAAEADTAAASVERILGSVSDATPRPDGKPTERYGGGRTRVFIGDARVRDGAMRSAMKKGSHALVTRHHVSIDRRSRRAADERFFSREVVAPFFDGLTFIADIDLGLLLADPEHGAADLRRLRAAVHAVFALGAGRSAGLGHVAMTLEQSEPVETIGDNAGSHTAVVIPEAASIELVLEALEPICAGDRLFTDSNYHASLGYLRASTLRGALITAAMTARGVRRDMRGDADFRCAVLDEATCLRISDATPLRNCQRPPRPAVAPFTLRTCKYGDEAHGCLDILVLHWIQAMLAATGHFLAFDESCQHRVGGGASCAARLKAAPERLGMGAPDRRVVTRVALDTARGRADHGKLFSIDLLETGTRFAVRIDRLTPYARDLLTDAQRVPIRVGHGRGQGYGSLRLVSARSAPVDDLAARIKAFDKAARRAWHAAWVHAGVEPAVIADPVPGKLLVTTTLENDLLPPAEASRPRLDTAFDHALGLKNSEMQFAAVRGGHRGGYDNHGNQQKEFAPMVTARSCLLLAVPDNDHSLERLAAIEEGGIGRCRDQGYGRIRISDPLHLPGWKATWRHSE